jgi:hypothetical protein
VISFTAEVEVKLRQTVNQSVRLGVRHPSGIRDQFPFLLEIFFRQLRVSYFVAPSLTRGRVCNLLLLLVLASVVPSPARVWVPRDSPYFIVPILEIFPTWRARSPYLYPPGTGWPRYTPGHWLGPLSVASYDSQVCGGGTLYRLHAGKEFIHLIESRTRDLPACSIVL